MKKVSFKKILNTFSVPILVYCQSLACPFEDYRNFMQLFALFSFVAIVVGILKHEDEDFKGEENG